MGDLESELHDSHAVSNAKHWHAGFGHFRYFNLLQL